MMKLNAYLTFAGDCQQAFDFYHSVFGGHFVTKSRFDELPESEEWVIDQGDLNKVMHVTLQINEQTLLMGSDVVGDLAPAFRVGNNFSVSVNLNDKEKASEVFKALADGGQVTMPMNETFWGSYFGMVTDQFGIQWMINCDLSTGQGR